MGIGAPANTSPQTGIGFGLGVVGPTTTSRGSALLELQMRTTERKASTSARSYAGCSWRNTCGRRPTLLEVLPTALEKVAGGPLVAEVDLGPGVTLRGGTDTDNGLLCW